MNKIIGIFLFFCFTHFSNAQVKIWESPKTNKSIYSAQWEVNDLIYHVKKKIEDPFKKNVFDKNLNEKSSTFYL